MKTLRGPLLAILAIVLTPSSVADDQAIAGLFARAGRDGTMVISPLAEGPTCIYNAARAQHEFSPASTFKILNSLIALEERVIAGKDEVLKWDEQTYDLKGLDHKSVQGRQAHVGFSAQNIVLKWNGDAGTEQDRRNYDQGHLKFPAFPEGTGGAEGSGGGIFEGFAEIHANPYENCLPQVFGPALVSEPGNFSYDYPDWNHDQTLASAYRVSCV